MILGIDVGDKRVGVAIASPIAKLPRPFMVLANDEAIFETLAQIIKTEKIQKIVVGLPRNQAGEETAQSQKARDFAGKLEDISNGEVVFADESLSSVRSENVPLPKGRSPNDPLDDIAACFILEEFFEGVE